MLVWEAISLLPHIYPAERGIDHLIYVIRLYPHQTNNTAGSITSAVHALAINTHSHTHTPPPQPRPCIHISGRHCARPLEQVIHWQIMKWDVIILEHSLVEPGWMGWETCVTPGLHYCRAAVHFTVARQRLTLCNRLVCQRVSHCVNVCSMGWERVGGRAVGGGGGGGGDGGVVIGVWWKISLWLSSQEMAWDIHFSVSLPPTLPLAVYLSLFPSLLFVWPFFFFFSSPELSFPLDLLL